MQVHIYKYTIQKYVTREQTLWNIKIGGQEVNKNINKLVSMKIIKRNYFGIDYDDFCKNQWDRIRKIENSH